MKKRLATYMLAVCLVLGLLPTTTQAAKPHPFQDVPASHWANASVQYVYENELMNGVSKTEFGPNGKLTRAMFVTILGRLAGVDTNEWQRSEFTDVPSGQWYSPYVSWASDRGIVGGYGNGKFGPTDNVTREQMAAMIARYVDAEGRSLPPADTVVGRFTDEGKVSSWAREGLELMRETGIISGYNDGSFGPKKTATRAEAATIFMRLAEAGVASELTVRFDSVGGTEVAAQKLEPGKKASKPKDPARDGYQFMGWYQKDVATEFDFKQPVNRSIVLYAQWAEKTTGKDTLYAYDPSHIAEDGAIKYVDNILLVYTKANLNERQKEEIAASVGGSVGGSMTEVTDILQVRVPRSSLDELEAMADTISKRSDVYSASIDCIMDDIVSSSGEYAYKNTDPWTYPGVNGRLDWWAEAIHCFEAWENYSQYFQPIKVGVVDSGFDANHPDLNIMFPDGKFKEGNVDDDHGTPVAGLIAAQNNNLGMSGVAYHAKLVCVDRDPYMESADTVTFFRSSDYFNAYNAILKSGARIINNSYGAILTSENHYMTHEKYASERNRGTTYEQWLNMFMTEVESTVVEWAKYSCAAIVRGWDPLFVQSAGNGIDNVIDGIGEGVDASITGYWCGVTDGIASSIADYYGLSGKTLLSHILVVGAVENDKKMNGNYKMTKYSSFGATVDICAPGGYKDIYTTGVNNWYTPSFWGTSAAAPIVSGAAAVVWSINPSLSAPEVRSILLNNHTVWAEKDNNTRYPMLDVNEAARAAFESRAETSVILKGRVLGEGNPLSGATICAEAMDGTQTIAATSDASGAFALELEAEHYHVTVTCRGYVSEQFNVDLTPLEGQQVIANLKADINLKRIDVSVTETISGIVVDINTGKPLAGMAVEYFSEMHYDDDFEIVYTDENGYFEFKNKQVKGDWWSLSVQDSIGYIYIYSYNREDNPTAEGYDTFDTFCGKLYMRPY